MIDFSNIPSQRVLVIGDIFLDIYKSGKATRICPEAPVPVVLVDDERACLGGAANVAANLRSLGCYVDLVGFTGNDRNGDHIADMLFNIKANQKIIRTDLPTTTKTRVLANNQYLVRYDVEQIYPSSYVNRQLICNSIKQLKDEQYDVVIISDYAKGVIDSSVVESVKSNFAKKKIFADIKPCNKSFYNDICCISPNLHEAVAISSVSSDGTLELHGRSIIKELNLECLIITLSENGLILFSSDGQIRKVSPYYYKPRNERHYKTDVIGAGDTLISVFAVSISSGNNIYDSVFLANMSAGIVVGKCGTSTCDLRELQEEYNMAGYLYA